MRSLSCLQNTSSNLRQVYSHLPYSTGWASRLWEDYRRINNIAKIDVYFRPGINDRLYCRHNLKFISAMYLASGYSQVFFDKHHLKKPTFIGLGGLYELKVMLFWLSYAPVKFQHVSNCLLRGLTWCICLCKMNGSDYFSSTFAEHWDCPRKGIVLSSKLGTQLN